MEVMRLYNLARKSLKAYDNNFLVWLKRLNLQHRCHNAFPHPNKAVRSAQPHAQSIDS